MFVFNKSILNTTIYLNLHSQKKKKKVFHLKFYTKILSITAYNVFENFFFHLKILLFYKKKKKILVRGKLNKKVFVVQILMLLC